MADTIKLHESWRAPLADALASPSMAALQAFLLAEKAAGKAIFPNGSEWFRALDLTSLDTVRVVILGQDPYHGPGQVVAYPLIDLQRAGYFIKEYVYRVEEAVIRTLATFGVTGHRVAGAPGIYVRLEDPGSHALLPQRPQKRTPGEPLPPPDFAGLGKIAALGIKVSRHCTYHGVALNVDMDLQPFQRINPCGYAGLQTVDLSTIGVAVSWDEAAQVLSQKLTATLAP